MKTKQLICLVLILALALSLAACGGSKPSETTASTQAVTEVPTDVTMETLPDALPEGTLDLPTTPTGTLSYFTMSLGLDRSILAYEDPDSGEIIIDFLDGERKSGTADASIMTSMTQALEKSGLMSMNGQEVYEDGDDSGNLYADFSDGSNATIGFSGNVPKEFIQGYEAMNTFFQELTADMPVYVPQPVVEGDVDPTLLSESQAILAGSNIEELDSMSIAGIPNDDAFGFMSGLSSADGITAASKCTSMMLTVPYSVVIVTLEDVAGAPAVINDFETNMGWNNWVCVHPTGAVIAQKDNMVLCFMGADEMFTGTSEAIEANGWEIVKALDNPM